MLEKVLVLLFALASIGIGIRSIITREARFSFNRWNRNNNYPNDDDEQIVEGFPAILVGLFEIVLGIYILVYRHTPW